MRRILLALPVAALLVAPAQAAAPKPKPGAWKATSIQRGYDMRFTVAGGKITKLVARVLEQCAGESTTSQTTVGPGLTWTIKGAKFSGRKKETADRVTLYTTLEGRFTSATSATGTLRQESIVAGATCDTYALKFTAKRR